MHCSALWKRCGRPVDHWRRLGCIALHCKNVVEGLRTIADHCSALQCIAEAFWEACRSLWIVVYCSTSSTPSGRVDHILTPLTISDKASESDFNHFDVAYPQPMCIGSTRTPGPLSSSWTMGYSQEVQKSTAESTCLRPQSESHWYQWGLETRTLRPLSSG